MLNQVQMNMNKIWISKPLYMNLDISYGNILKYSRAEGVYDV